MAGNFFGNYKEFIVIPTEKKEQEEDTFNPQDFSKHFVITVSLYDSLISNWKDPNRYGISVEKSLKK